jgi:2-methylcitrate dehydratase PrpD
MVAEQLAEWAAGLVPSEADERLAQRSLVDTCAVHAAARDHPLGVLAERLGEAGRWAVLAHVLDFDDLHMESTTHISAVCVPAALATDGGARAYLAGAGVMARLGVALGWPHYQRGWHATCTAGAPAAAAAAAAGMGLGARELAVAMALAVPAAGGVHRAFGTAAKSLQVGFAVDAGVRAAELAAAGASTDPAALDQWLELVGGDPARLTLDGPAVPGGLAVKLYPCCYALQRPMAAARELRAPDGPITVSTPAGTLQPLIHDHPRTGLEGKFSLHYGIAAALLDEHPGFASFTDEAVVRPEAQAIVERVRVNATPGGDWLLAGEVAIEAGGRTVRLARPPGAPDRPPTPEQLAAKVADCGGDPAVEWETAGAALAG